MPASATILQGAMARLEARWGSAAIRLGDGGLTAGATALAPLPESSASPESAPAVRPSG